MPRHFTRIIALLIVPVLAFGDVPREALFVSRQIFFSHARYEIRGASYASFTSQALALDPVFRRQGPVEPIREAIGFFENGESDAPLSEIRSVMHPESDFDRAIQAGDLDLANTILKKLKKDHKLAAWEAKEMRRALKAARNHVVLADAFVIIDQAENAMFDLLKQLKEGTFSMEERDSIRDQMRDFLQMIEEQYKRILHLKPKPLALKIMRKLARNTIDVAQEWIEAAEQMTTNPGDRLNEIEPAYGESGRDILEDVVRPALVLAAGIGATLAGLHVKEAAALSFPGLLLGAIFVPNLGTGPPSTNLGTPITQKPPSLKPDLWHRWTTHASIISASGVIFTFFIGPYFWPKDLLILIALGLFFLPLATQIIHLLRPSVRKEIWATFIFAIHWLNSEDEYPPPKSNMANPATSA